LASTAADADAADADAADAADAAETRLSFERRSAVEQRLTADAVSSASAS